MIRQSALLDLKKQKAELAMDQQKEKTNSNKVKSLLKQSQSSQIVALEKMIRTERSSCVVTLVKIKKNS